MGCGILTDPATRARIGPLQRIVPVPAAAAPRPASTSSSCRTSTGTTSTCRRCATSDGACRSSCRPAPDLAARGRVRARRRDRRRGRGRRRRGHGARPSPRCTRGSGRPSDRRRRRSASSPRLPHRVLRRRHRPVRRDGRSGGPIDLALLPVWGWGPTLGRGLHMDPLRAAESLRRIRPRAAVPIHWGTYWPHAMGRVYPEPPRGTTGGVRRVRRGARARRARPADRGRHDGRVAGLRVWQTGRP